MLPDANGLVETLKKVAVDAVEATKPVNVCFGEVISTDSLKINVEQKMILGEKQLILTRSVTLDNELQTGDSVILLRQQGGQKFVVIDVIGGDET